MNESSGKVTHRSQNSSVCQNFDDSITEISSIRKSYILKNTKYLHEHDFEHDFYYTRSKKFWLTNAFIFPFSYILFINPLLSLHKYVIPVICIVFLIELFSSVLIDFFLSLLIYFQCTKDLKISQRLIFLWRLFDMFFKSYNCSCCSACFPFFCFCQHLLCYYLLCYNLFRFIWNRIQIKLNYLFFDTLWLFHTVMHFIWLVIFD